MWALRTDAGCLSDKPKRAMVHHIDLCGCACDGFRYLPRAVVEAIDPARCLRDSHIGRYHHGADQGDEITPFHVHLRKDRTVTTLVGYFIGKH